MSHERKSITDFQKIKGNEINAIKENYKSELQFSGKLRGKIFINISMI